MVWKTPRNWGVEDAVTKARLNQISDNLAALKNPPSDEYFLPAVDISTTSTVPVDIDPNGGLVVTTTGGDLLIGLNLVLYLSAGSIFGNIDLLLNNLIYASTKTPSYHSRGLWHFSDVDVGDHTAFSSIFRWTGLSAGTYSIMPQMWVTSSTFYIWGANTTGHWWARED